MSLLLRRKALMGAQGEWDGKECVAVGSNGRLYWSNDYGKTFVDTNWSSAASHACVTRNRDRGNNGAYVFLTQTNSTVHWTTLPLRTDVAFVSSGSVNITAPGRSICASGDGTVAYVPTNVGSSWQTDYQCYVRKITRSGATLSQAVKGIFNTWDQAADYASACSNDGKYAVIGGAVNFTNGFQTTDTGETWTECLATSSYGNGVRRVCCDFAGSLFIASQGTVGRSTVVDNLGANWVYARDPSNCEAVAGSRKFQWFQYKFSPSGINQVWDYTDRSGYPRSTWITLETKLVFTDAACNKFGDKAIGISEGEIYYTHDWGRTWIKSSTPVGVSFVEIDMTKCD